MVIIWLIYIYITFILLLCSCRISSTIQSHNSNLILLFFFIFIFIGTFATFTGDYLGYQEFINDVIIEKSNINMEAIYIDLVKITEGNIHLFRFVIFIITFILLYYLLKITNNLDLRIIFIYAAIELLTAIDGRQQISIYLFLIGCIIIWKYHFRITGMILIITCVYFHKSAFFLLLGIPFIFINFTKTRKYLLFIIFPVLVYTFKYLFNYIIIANELEFLGDTYLKQESISFLPTMIILLITKPILIMSLSLWVLYKSKLDYAPKYINNIYRWLFGIVYINCIIAFLPIENYIIIYERFLRPQVMAAILILPYCIKPKLTKNLILLFFLFAIFFYANSYIILQVFRQKT